PGRLAGELAEETEHLFEALPLAGLFHFPRVAPEVEHAAAVEQAARQGTSQRGPVRRAAVADGSPEVPKSPALEGGPGVGQPAGRMSLECGGHQHEPGAPPGEVE